MLEMLSLLAQTTTPPTSLDWLLQVVNRGGPGAAIVLLCVVVVYQQKANAALHDALHKRDEEHATKLVEQATLHGSTLLAEAKAHAAATQAQSDRAAQALREIQDERVEEMESVIAAASTLRETLKLATELAPKRRGS